MPIISLPLHAITFDLEIQSRQKIDENTVREYREAMDRGNSFPPVHAVRSGENYLLYDGFHRYRAYELRLEAMQGKEPGATLEIEVEIQNGTRRSAMLLATMANITNALRRNSADKRRSVRRLLRDSEWSGWSNVEISKRCGVSEFLVRTIRKEVTSINRSDAISQKDITGEIPQSPTRTYKDRWGNVTTMETSNIGKAPDAPAHIDRYTNQSVINVGQTDAWQYKEVPVSQPQTQAPTSPQPEPEPDDEGDDEPYDEKWGWCVSCEVNTFLSTYDNFDWCCPECGKEGEFTPPKPKEEPPEVAPVPPADELVYEYDYELADAATDDEPDDDTHDCDDEPDEPVTTEANPREVLHSSESKEWYTPGDVIELAREVLGTIDLDPATCVEANTVVQATTIYTATDDGLSKDWFGNVWCNPPYGLGDDNKSNQARWSAEMDARFERGEFDAGLLLVNATTAAVWFHAIWHRPVVFVRGRLRFLKPDGLEVSDKPTHSTAIFYFGREPKKFAQVFSPLGRFVPGQEVAHA